MRNKLMKVMASAALLSSIAVPSVGAASNTAKFSDIDGSFAKEAINELIEKGIVNGKGDGKFDPTGKIERQDFAIILARALGLDISSAPPSPTFSDVPSSNYAYTSVEAAVKAGLINGQGNGIFGTGSNLSRQDMAVLFTRALGVDVQGKGADLKFSDAGSIADYAKDAVGAAVELGLINGGTDGKFDPKGGAAREAVALVASRFLDAKEKIDSQKPPAQPDPPTTPTEPTKPATPAPPVTSSPSSSSGSSNSGGGGSSDGNSSGNTPSQPDTTAPTVTLVSKSPLNIGDPIKLISSKEGEVYVVPYAENPTSKADLVALPNKFVDSVLYANQVTEIGTSFLSAGEYKVYVVDYEGRMSAPSSKIVLQNNPKITLKNGGESFVLVGKEGAILKDFTYPDAPSSTDRNINDWIQVQWHGKSLEMFYNSTQHNFKVFEGDHPVATIEVSSGSSPISIEPTESGIHIQPTEKATETTKAVLHFILKSYTTEEETQQELGHVDLPIRFDLTAPTVTDATYQNGAFTVSVDQQLYQVEGSPIHIEISYSPSGEFGNDVYFLQDEEFGVRLSDDHKQFTISVMESALNELPLSEKGKFRLAISGLRDETGNLSEEETRDIKASNADPTNNPEGE